MKVAVIGLGYVGLVQAACFAKLGHIVLGIDLDVQKIASLQSGMLPFFEPGLEDVLRESVQRLSCTNSIAALEVFKPEVILICVPTPARADGSCETQFVARAIAELAVYVLEKTVVVIKSTVPPGIRKDLQYVETSGLIELASVPEFLREGKAVKDFFQPDRLVFGVQSVWAEQVLRALHKGIEAPICVMSVESAQLSKYASNAMLATRLSFMNEIANIADVVGADIEDIERVVGSDKRIGKMFLRSGAGFGGSCFPKDVLALSQAARLHGYETRIIEPIIEINADQPRRFVNKVRERLGDFSQKTIAVWGLAFNGNTDDVRESPAIKVIELLLAQGAAVQVYDPRAMKQAYAFLQDRVTYATSMQEALYGAETLLILTEWPEFMKADWNDIAHALASPYLFDGKNFLSRAQIQQAGLIYCGIGICSDVSRPLGN